MKHVHIYCEETERHRQRMIPKGFQIRNAVTWLKRFEAKGKGKRSYVNPQIYTLDHCKHIINSVNDVDLRNAGVNADEARRLVAEAKEN